MLPVCADLDHLNEGLRSALKDWLIYLKDVVGFEGWRFDFVKGYGPEFVKEYVADTVGEGTFNVGEYWVDLRCAFL
jgi:alpha-amylase